MAVYTPAELVAPTQLSNVAGTLYTVPGATTAIIRTIHVQTTASAHTFTLSVGADAAATRIFDAYALTPNVPSQFNGMWVVPTGVVIQGFASAATSVTVMISGYTFA